MCLFTHFAAGALAGGATGNVYAGVVAGLASHAVLDAIPHYDHPDWRVELTGGMASLALLLVLPFGSAAAVAGGLAGMAPDLENLFQKLGWMGRDRFVFPSHTGLVPHGRTLGPRSLAWQVAIFVACFVALGLLRPGEAAAQAAPAARGDAAVMAPPRTRVLSADANATVVRVAFPARREPADWEGLDPGRVYWSTPGPVLPGEVAAEPPAVPVALAVPRRGPPEVLVRDVRWWRRPDAAVAPGDLVASGPPAVQRGVPVAAVEVAAGRSGGVLREVTLEIRHAPDAYGRALLAAPAVKAAVPDGRGFAAPASLLNGDLHARLADGARDVLRTAAAARPAADASSLFALTGNWLRLHLDETGLYRLTGSELVDLGVPVAAVDPDKLRLYRGGGFALDEDPAATDAGQPRRVGLNEVAVEVLDGDDGEWNLTDELRFYGVATSAWRDRLEADAAVLPPGASRLDHYDHPFAPEAVYWLTWADDLAPASPLPGTPRRVVTVQAPSVGGAPRTSGQVRLRREEQYDLERGLTEDDFVWDKEITGSRQETFVAHRPVPGSPTRFVAEVRGVVSMGSLAGNEVEAQLNFDSANRGATAFVSSYSFSDSLVCRVGGTSPALQPGTNALTVYDVSVNDRAVIALDAFSVMYEDRLVLEDAWGPLAFGLWGDEVPAAGTTEDLTITSDAEVLLWDVTAPDSALVLRGTPAGGATTYGIVRSQDRDRHFVAARPRDLLRVPRTSDRPPVALRDQDPAVDYVVVAPEAFMAAAEELAAYRSQSLPGVAAPRARAVDVQDVYDSFSGGQKDAFALRDYFHWLHEQGGGRLAYVCLLGNASRDPRGYLSEVSSTDLVDLVPTDMFTPYPRVPEEERYYSPYASDDGLVSFDTPPPSSTLYPGRDAPDVAVGRLPALDAEEALALVRRTIDMDRSPVAGAWRNRVTLLADDTWHRNQSYETAHTNQAELVAEQWVPRSVDVSKLFAAAYPFPPGSGTKPEVTRLLLDELDAGTTIFYYVGHGSEDNLGDEQYFRSHMIAGLTNGMRRTVFMAFSCDVGVHDSYIRRSMAEQFVTAEGGGAIAAICASQVSWISDNEALTDAFFQAQFPGAEVSADVTLGGALLAAKGALGGLRAVNNAVRYTLFGDPALRLPHPVNELTFVPDMGDTLRPGFRQEVAVAPTGAGALLGAGDAWDLRVEESAHTAYYVTGESGGFIQEHPWTRLGGPAYRGNGVLATSSLRVPFKSPAQSRTGPRGRVRILVDDGGTLRAGVMTVPVVRAPLGEETDVVGPTIAMAFADGRYRVTPGTVLAATLQDSSSIAVLGSAPGNSISLEYDDSGFLVDVTDAFVFDAGSHQSGRVEVAVPGDLELGPHMVELIAADALGNVSRDSLAFEMVAAGAGGIHDVTLFPNPTPGPCRLVFELSEPMEVRWDIYTVAGRRVATVLPRDGRIQGPGPTVLHWEGRDAEGDALANGTYLYVLRGVGGGRDGRDLNRTGKLVIMR